LGKRQKAAMTLKQAISVALDLTMTVLLFLNLLPG
jgi:hypothetical protein